MIRKRWAAMPLPERRGPPCKGPLCFMKNGPCHPGCTPDAGTAKTPVWDTPEPTQSTNGSLSVQRRDRLRRFLVWVLLVASVLAALSTIADGLHALIDLISKFL